MNKLAEHPALPWLLAGLSCLLVLAAVWSGLQLDDHFQRYALLGMDGPSIDLFVFYDGDPVANRALMDTGELPWWSSETLRHANFRYLSVLTMQLDYLLWPDSPALMHMHSLLWLGGLVLAVTALYRQLAPTMVVAALAALFYAIDDAHAIPAVYLANRNSLIAACFGVLSILYYIRHASEGHGRSLFASLVFLALALSAAEIAVSTFAYLLAFALCLDERRKTTALLALWPHALVLGGWAAIYRLGAYGASGSGFYVDPLGNPLQFAGTLIDHSVLLLLGQWSPIPADLAGASAGVEFLRPTAWAIVLVLAIVLAPLLLVSRSARYWCLGSLLSLLPIAATGPQNRLLLFVGIGAMGLAAEWIMAVVGRDARLPGRLLWRVPAYAVTAGLLITHLLLGPLLSWVYLDVQSRASSAMVGAIESIPDDPALRDQTLVLVNPPGYVYVVSAIHPVLALQDRPVPGAVRALVHGGTEVTVTRRDETTLEISPQSSLFPTPFSRYHRSAAEPMQPGDSVSLEGFTASVMSVDTRGNPDTLVFEFEVPLEDASLRWMAWQDGVYRAWPLPAIGDSVTLPAQAGIFE